MSPALDIDNALCLACSSSIRSKQEVSYITRCCGQVICDSCIQANPRLANYDPCLACLGGISAASSRPNPNSSTSRVIRNSSQFSVLNKDEGMFVLGDDSDEDAEEQHDTMPKTAQLPEILHLPPRSFPPAALSVDQKAVNHSIMGNPHAPTALPPLSDVSSPTHDPSTISPSRKYYINPRDSVHGIALRFGVEARELCQLNKLPPSTLSTTPHLLHTRAFLELPPSSKPVPLQYVLTEEDQSRRDSQRVRERAEKRLQMVTKEVDWRVAKAYVALAGDPEVVEEFTTKYKEGLAGVPFPAGSVPGPSNAGLEATAVDMYLEDEEWEQGERRASRFPQTHRFPLQTTATPPERDKRPNWWPWKS